MKKHIVSILKSAIGIGLLIFLYFRLKDPAALWESITKATGWMLLLGALMYTLAVALSGIKWGILLQAVGIPVSVRRLLEYQWLAEFFNNFLPAQVGGDVMRGFALASDTQRRADSAASVLIDRFIGLTIFMIASAFASSGMFLFGRPDGAQFVGDQKLYMQIIVLGSVAASILLVCVITALLSHRLKDFAGRVLAMLPFGSKLKPIWDKLAEAFDTYKSHPRALLLTATSSAGIVILTSINIWLISQAISPKSISLVEVLAVNPIIVFVLLALPLSPGGLGIRQSVFSFTYGLIGANTDVGFAVGLLQQLIGYLVSLPGVYLWIRGRNNQNIQSIPSTNDTPSVA